MPDLPSTIARRRAPSAGSIKWEGPSFKQSPAAAAAIMAPHQTGNLLRPMMQSYQPTEQAEDVGSFEEGRPVLAGSTLDLEGRARTAQLMDQLFGATTPPKGPSEIGAERLAGAQQQQAIEAVGLPQELAANARERVTGIQARYDETVDDIQRSLQSGTINSDQALQERQNALDEMNSMVAQITGEKAAYPPKRGGGGDRSSLLKIIGEMAGQALPPVDVIRMLMEEAGLDVPETYGVPAQE